MEPPPLTPPPIRTKTRSPWAAVGIGCGLVVLLLILGGIGLAFWLLLPGRAAVSLDRVPGPDTVGIIHLKAGGNDPGIKALVAEATRMQQEMSRRQMQAALPGTAGRVLGMLSTAGPVNYNWSMLPEAMVAFERPASAGEPAPFIVVANLHGMPRFTLRMFAFAFSRQPGMTQETHRGQRLFPFGTNHWAGVSGRTVMVSDDLERFKRMLDRAAERTPPVGFLQELPLALTARWDLYAVLRNEDNCLARVVEPLGRRWDLGGDAEATGEEDALTDVPPPETADPDGAGLIELTIGLDVESAEAVAAQVALRGADPAAAAAWAERTAENLDRTAALLREQGLEVGIERSGSDERVEFSVRVTGVSAALQKAFEAVAPAVP